jgi:triosephosphate isomerase (TIM)
MPRLRKRRAATLRIGAQNLYWGKEGAVTGEVSGHMLQAVGCRYVIVAHSERRQYFGEIGARMWCVKRRRRSNTI